jgi:hypothetical protein
MTRFDKPAMGAIGKLATTGDLRKTAEREVAKITSPILEKLTQLERRVEEIGRQPVPPPMLRKVIAEPAADPGYDAIAGLLEKAARAGLGREFDDAASQLRRRCDSAPAMAAASAIDHQNFRGWK